MYNRESILEELFSRTAQGIKFGLDRIEKSVNSLGNPHNSFNTVHVAGTNGKGSVCAFIESILRHNGYSTGMFTSPHISGFEERFVLNGKPSKTHEWLGVYRDIEDIINKYYLTFFEISTILAFELFKRKKVDWGIIETGLGGRLDATNIIKPEISVVTNIDIDHTDYLGTDIISVAKEKLGIVKAKVPLVIDGENDPEIIEMARNVCVEKTCPYIIADKAELKDIMPVGKGTKFSYKNRVFTIALPGSYQVMNALCAIKAVETLDFTVDENMVEAIEKTIIPCRFQIVEIKGKKIIFDVAHNSMAAKKFTDALKMNFGHVPVCIIAGIMSDKDSKSMMQRYAECSDTIICTRPDTSRALPARNLAEKVPDNYTGTVEIINRVKDAVHFACERYTGIICVTGSFYTVGEAMDALGIVPYK